MPRWRVWYAGIEIDDTIFADTVQEAAEIIDEEIYIERIEP